MSEALSYAELALLPAREMSMGLALSWQAARDPDRPALTMGDNSLTRMQLDRIVNRRARALAEYGIGQDDCVVIVLPTGPLHQIMAFAAWKLGASVVPLPPKLVDVELAKLASIAKPAVVIGIDPARLPEHRVIPADFPVDETLSDAPLPEVVAKRWKGITSGGSTGMPKLIWEEKPSLIHPLQPLTMLQIAIDDVILHPAGAYHNSPFSQTNWGLCWGGHIVLMERFDALGWLQAVQRHKIRWAYMVPTMMSRVLAIPEDVRLGFDMSSIKVLIHMAAPCPAWVKQAWIDWLGPEKIIEVYAGTEGYGFTLLTGTEWLAHPGTIGKAPEGTQVWDEDGKLLPPGEIGTLYFRPPLGNVLGVSQDPHSYGDMGWLDEDGYMYLADRRTDMIVSGGGNLYPAEIEAAIEQFPGVVAVAVIGLPHADLGAVAHAIIEMAPGNQGPEPNRLAAFLLQNLGRNKHPRSYEVATVPLRDDAGKMRRSRLRAERIEGGSFNYYPL